MSGVTLTDRVEITGTFNSRYFEIGKPYKVHRTLADKYIRQGIAILYEDYLREEKTKKKGKK